MTRFKLDDKSKAICPFCDKIQPTTFKIRNVPMRYKPDVVVSDCLVAVCDGCDKTIGIPQQSAHLISAYNGWKPVIYSGICLCGHTYDDHHCCCVVNPEAYKVLGPVVPDECNFFGCNEEGGLDENGNPHCFGYCDIDEVDEEKVKKWKGTKR